MNMMHLDLPDMLRTFVDEQVIEHAYDTDGEYVRELIRRERDRQHLRRLLLEGMESPLTEPVDDEYFAGLEERARLRAGG